MAYADQQPGDTLYMIWPDFIDPDGKPRSDQAPLPVGETLSARMMIVVDEMREQVHRARIAPGVRFYCHEGGKRVAEGVVTRITGLPLTATPVTKLVSAGFSVRPAEFAVWDNSLYFSCIDQMKGIELWRYDGSNATVVTDIFAGPNHASPQDLITYQNTLYFTATDGIHGRELWKYDGHNTSMVQDLLVGPDTSSISKGLVFNDNLYFAGRNTGVDRELFKTDGNQITLAADIWPGPGNSMPYPPELTIFQDALYFKASVDGSNYRLWRYDGNQFPAAVSTQNLQTAFAQPTVFDNKLLVVGSTGQTLYAFDGVQLSPFIGNSVAQHFGMMTPLGSDLVFSRSQSEHAVDHQKLEPSGNLFVPYTDQLRGNPTGQIERFFASPNLQFATQRDQPLQWFLLEGSGHVGQSGPRINRWTLVRINRWHSSNCSSVSFAPPSILQLRERKGVFLSWRICAKWL